MSQLASNYQQNVHQVGQTVAWSLIFNVAVIAAALRYDKVAALGHSIFGILVLVLTYTFVLYYLIPLGFNAGDFDNW
jgi:hypothetical protein